MTRWRFVTALAFTLSACGGAASVVTDDAATVSPDVTSADTPFQIDLPTLSLHDQDAGVIYDVQSASDAPADVRNSDASGRGPPYPIVLVHGFAGFRDIGPVNYYFNVARDLRARGETVFEAELTPFAPPAQRAPILARYLDTVVFPQTRSAKVILVAHSQGGLDSRYLISSMGYGDRVAALVTISTPHQGTRIADAFLGYIPGGADPLLNVAATLFGFSYNDVRNNADLRNTLHALSERNAPAFNQANPDDARVAYWSYGGRSNRRDGREVCQDATVANSPNQLDNTALALFPFASFLEQGNATTHANDGMVEVRSARWGRFGGCIPADHFDEVGQIAHLAPNLESGFFHLQFYRDLVQRLRREGF
jgi:triacylglycerol lipase